MDQTDPAIERRHFSATDMQLSADGKKLVGYAVKFNSPSELLGGRFREQVLPGAFKKSLAETRDIKALIEHDPKQLLGRTKNKTLTLSEDGVGLRFELALPDTSAGRDAAESVRRQDRDGMSFSFRRRSGGDRWYRQNGEERRDLLDVELLEVTLTADPAYPDTSVALRSLSEAERLPIEQRNRNRLRLAEADAPFLPGRTL